MNTNLKPTDQDNAYFDGTGIPAPSSGTDGANNIHSNGSTTNSISTFSTLDDASLFDLLENPQFWPDDPNLQKELAELLEIHLVMSAHAEKIVPALETAGAFKRFATHWLMPAAAIALAVLPTLYVVNHVRETRRMQAKGAELEVEMQKRLQAGLWSDFFDDSMVLLKHVQTPATYCAPTLEDRAWEVEQARKLYAVGRSLPLDSLNGLDDPEAHDIKAYLQNWLTEVSANDSCITPKRSLELSALAHEMDLEGKTNRLNHKLKGAYS